MSFSSLHIEDVVGAPPDLRTLVDISRFRAATTPQCLAYTFLLEGETAESNFTYWDLDRRARAIAAHLQERDAENERVLLVFEPGLDYVSAILGCFYAGAVAVPVYPPDPFRLARTLPRLRAVVKNADARFLLSTAEVLGDQGGSLWDICGQGTIVSQDIADSQASEWREPSNDPQRIALLQYTSGSTGEPRGVTLTHANLMHNFRTGFHLMDVPRAVGVHWLPPYHDMGLIGGILLPLYAGRRTVLMSPLAFMQRPFRWLQAIHRYRGTTTGGPNFAYDLCVRKIKPEECEGLDLTCWKVAVNGAEPVRADTLNRFAEKFAPFGFRRETLMPAYGMAETTLIISAAPIEAAPTEHSFDARELEKNRVQRTPANHPHARKLVACGPPAKGMDVQIVDPETHRRVGANQVGEIWVRSPSVGQGYWNRPDDTKRVFNARLAGSNQTGYLRTGDLGFLHQGELYIIGRIKELIILGGRNYYPHDLERAVQEAHPALKGDGGAAFSIDHGDEERLVLVHEVVRPKRFDLEEVIAAVRQSLALHFDLAAHAIVLIPSGSLPKTSSGKTRRRQCRDDFLAGRLNVLKSWTAEALPHVLLTPGGEHLPQTPTEIDLAAIWCDLLGLEQLNRESDFFALGAQSLRAAQLVARVAERWGVQLPIQRLFDDPTLRGMAKLLDAAVAQSGEVVASAKQSQLPISRSDNGGPYPLSLSQQRIWFLEQLGGGRAAAHVPVIVELSGQVDVDSLQNALRDVVVRHDMLRARIYEIDGAPRQEIQSLVDVPWDYLDLSHEAPLERTQQLAATKERWRTEPFDFQKAPLARAGLVKLSDDRYVFGLVLHHIICDGWSIELLLRDLQTAYVARQSNGSPRWTTSPMRYVDFANWQAANIPSGDEQEDLTYWRNRLDGVPPALDLPTDHPRGASTASRPASATCRAPAPLRRAIERLAREQGATPFMIHLAVFQAVLSRYAGRDDLCVGTAVAGRTRSELEQTVGCFINTVALRGDLSGDPTFADLVRRSRNVIFDDLAHSQTPFEQVVELVQPQRRPGTAPLVQAFFLYQTPAFPVDTLGEAKIEARESDYSGLALFDVSLVIEENGDELQIALVYDRSLFDESTMDSMLDALIATLARVTVDDTTTLSRLPVPGPGERKRLIHEWNSTQTDVPRVDGFHELFEKQVALAPDAVAIEFASGAWTYRELNTRAEIIANTLRHLGVTVNTPVGVHLTRRPELVAALLGVSKAGGAYVPLDPEYPSSRLEFMIEDCEASVILTEKSLTGTLPKTDAFVIEVEELLPSGRNAKPPCPEFFGADKGGAHAARRERFLHRVNGSLSQSRLAYLIYTSGSTGTPKGVMVTQQNVVNFLAAMEREPGLSRLDCMLAVTTVSFDIAVLELLLPLSTGARIAFADRPTVVDGRRLAQFISEHGATVMQATPATYRMLLSSGWRPRAGVKLLVGGEALTANLARELLQDDVELWNMYGPTETTVWSAIHRVQWAVDPMPIGRPIANTQLFIVDAQGRLAPRGAIGELWIGGQGVAAGYWRRPELTRERFVPNGLDATLGATMYRTGDLARWRSDGEVEFLGRTDSQVKIRGYRIELGEIEAALSQHPDVLEAAVLAPTDTNGERRLTGYYSLVAKAAVTPESLRSYLADRLPNYMTPTAYIPLPEMPHTPAGKIDRRILPELTDGDFARSTPFIPPRTPLERELADAWSEVLKVDRIGIEDSFFELGGHSLMAAQLASRLRQRLQTELPLIEFYRRPTIAGLAEAILRHQAKQDEGRQMESLIERLESMSDSDVEAFLRDRKEL
jgi:amino acid adenylation domain-containing protein